MSASAEKGVSGGGLIMVVHPAARAAPSLRVIIAEGKFHGVRMELIEWCVNHSCTTVYNETAYTTPVWVNLLRMK